jgi:hypothetical protein
MLGLLLLFLLSVVWLRYASDGRYRPLVDRALGSAVTVGLIGFALGFVGPMVLAPGANQGPMLGIFITGPLGFVAGLVWGLWRGWSERA